MTDTKTIFPPFSLAILLRRIGRCRGFGIQSPTDFAFVNEVIYERSPYYAYASLNAHYPTLSHFERKIAQALFRISNYVQPVSITIPCDCPEVWVDYLRHGCTKAEVVQATDEEDGDCFTLHSQEGDCIIVADIYGRGADRWQKVVDVRHANHLVMFDLYYFGVAFVRERRYAELHTVNFY